MRESEMQINPFVIVAEEYTATSARHTSKLDTTQNAPRQVAWKDKTAEERVEIWNVVEQKRIKNREEDAAREARHNQLLLIEECAAYMLDVRDFYQYVKKNNANVRSGYLPSEKYITPWPILHMKIKAETDLRNSLKSSNK